MVKRLKLQTTLEQIMKEALPHKLPDSSSANAFHVYYQPENNLTMTYPAIVYSIGSAMDRKANNGLYSMNDRYTVTVIDRNPDSKIPNLVRQLPMSSLTAQNKYDGLYHTIFTVYI